MDEKEFLELSDRERDEFIAEKIFGQKEHTDWWWWDTSTLTFDDVEPSIPVMYCGPHFSTTWESMGMGIEHANTNGFHVTTTSRSTSKGMAQVGNRTKLGYPGLDTEDVNVFIAFWISYCKVLGVLR